jgi:tRNA 2-thiouridine synthesizing protein A
MSDTPGKLPNPNARTELSVQEGEILVDARGHHCPVPTLRLQRALKGAAPGQRLRLLADDPMARIDVPHLLAAKGYSPPEILMQGNTLVFIVETPA